ncbi:glycosyltransferase [Micrococcus terreus]|uniref:glycosyltransferase n=1 Tax=Micrococcus terreus TaxID=574650 RepID=UPI00340EFCED
MNILVYPHDLGMGGSQINAIDLATALRDEGHDVAIFGPDGVLVDRLRQKGLEFIQAPSPRIRPTPAIIRALRQLIRERSIDVVHGYEWPPALEAFVACRGTQAVPVATVLSMGIAPFIPLRMPLMVGTEQILAGEQRAGRSRLALMEPPIDTKENAAGGALLAPEQLDMWGIEPESVHIVVVSRLAREMKMEGILAAIEAVGVLGSSYPIQLIVVGDGDAAGDISRRADEINESLDRRAVVLTGELEDPRSMYDLADIALGMGSSALRAMAFGKPLIVQGIQGYWEPLTEETLPQFLWQGWYGAGAGVDKGTEVLVRHLRHLLDHPEELAPRGALGLTTLQHRFSLESATRRQADFYEHAVADRPQISDWWSHPVDDFRSILQWTCHEVSRRVQQQLGRGADEDFNSHSTLVRERNKSAMKVGESL